MNTDLISLALAFTQGIQQGKSIEELEYLLDASVTQIEYPNALLTNIARRSLSDMKDAAERGRKVISAQTYEVIKTYQAGDTAILETIWKGKLAVPVGKLAVGDEMLAYFAQFYTFKNGKIIEIRNYDCFVPFQ